jgi:uncharacterized protein DUF4338
MRAMREVLVVQGRRLEPAHIERIRQLIAANPGWSRRRLSEALCAEWDWRNAAGRPKDMAARSLLGKLQARGLIELPPPRQRASNRMLGRKIPARYWDLRPVEGTLQEVVPLVVREVSTDAAERLRFAAALAQFHYLGWRGAVGENLQYTLTDASGRLLACVLFGSAAWKCRARDEFIGWTAWQRQQRLHLVTNNARFLILPYVKIAHLASWVLGQILRRLSQDWQKKYGHGIVLVESFVERERFAGTAYKAANWSYLGATSGRSRQDWDHSLHVPVKDVYLYALRRGFREELCA